MFVAHLTRALKLPGLARSAEPVWVTPRGVRPDYLDLERVSPSTGYYLVHDWVAEPHLFEDVEAMYQSVGGELVAHPVTTGDRTDPIIDAFLDERLWLWRVPVLSVPAPAVFPEKPRSTPPPGKKPSEVLTWIEVSLVDEDDKPEAGAHVRITRPGGEVVPGVLDKHGRFRIDPIQAGTCDVSFPDIEGREWGLKGASDEGDLRPAAPSTWEAAADLDCLSSIAKNHGFGRIAPLLDAPENEPLWKERPNPNVLQKGDRVFVPERLERVEAASTGRHHRYRRASWQTKLRVRIEEAQPGDPCTVHVGGRTQEVTLKSHHGLALLDIYVPADATSAEAEIPTRDLVLRFRLGTLDPVETTRGQQQRLQNLGYPIRDMTGEMDPHTRRSVHLFQRDEGLISDGIPGPDTQRRLLKVHGC